MSDRILNNKKYTKLWELLDAPSSEINTRLINAITWIGMAIDEAEDSIAFVEVIFAIEGLLKLDSGDFITPSISSQISEYAAFIVGKNKDDRIKIAQKFKKLYSLRSNIAHGYSLPSNIATSVDSALKLSRDIIFTLLNDSLYENIFKFKDLTIIINNLKFS